MKEMTLIVNDKVGVLAEMSYVLGRSRVNIESLSVEVHGGKAIINLLVDDGDRAEAVLREKGYSVLSSDALVVRMKDEPGALSEVSELLKAANVSVGSLVLLSRAKGHTLCALIVDKPAEARKVLGKYLVKGEK